jgi:PAS domain-containing protein/DNA-binding CsgD family transcriptional regulator
MPDQNLNETLKVIAESIPGNVALIKPDGYIQCVNQNWVDFASQNGILRSFNWQSCNYLSICRDAIEKEKKLAEDILQGIQNLLDGIVSNIFFEYACHSPIEQRWFEFRAHSIEIQGQTFVCLMHFNVSERVKAQQKLMESQKMFHTISENAPFGICLSRDNKYYYANAKLLNYLEYDHLQKFIDTPILETVHPDDKHIIIEKLKQIKEKRAFYPFELKARFISALGKIRYMAITVHQVNILDQLYNLEHVVDETDLIHTERSEKQLVIDALYLNRKQEVLESFSQFIEEIKNNYSFTEQDIVRFYDLKNQFKFQANDWNMMKTHFRLIHKDFFHILAERFPKLTQNDLNFCAMLKLNFSSKEIARYLNVKDSSVKRRRVRLKKKLNLNKEDNLIAFIQAI